MYQKLLICFSLSNWWRWVFLILLIKEAYKDSFVRDSFNTAILLQYHFCIHDMTQVLYFSANSYPCVYVCWNDWINFQIMAFSAMLQSIVNFDGNCCKSTICVLRWIDILILWLSKYFNNEFNYIIYQICMNT